MSTWDAEGRWSNGMRMGGGARKYEKEGWSSRDEREKRGVVDMK